MTKTMTEGGPAKLIFFFTLPLLGGNLFQQFYNMMDTLIVGQTLGVDALAAVGCTGSIMFLIIGFVQGMTAGLSIVTARHFGANDLQGVRRSFAANIVIGAVVTIVLTAFSVPLARPILIAMNTPASILDDAYSYIVIIYVGVFAAMLFNMLSNVLRALGDSRTPLLFLVLSSILNVVLDLGFIIVFHMGVAGAAWATVIAQVVSGLLCIIYIKKKFPILHVQREDFRLTRGELWQHAIIGLPMGFQASIIGIGVIILQIVLNAQGEQAVAAYTAAQKIEQILCSPLTSFGMTMATYAAQNYGAGKIHRIRMGMHRCAAMSLGYTAVVTCLATFGGVPLARLFVSDAPAVVEMAAQYLRLTSLFYWTLSLLFILRYTLQGLGQGIVPTIAGIMELVMRAAGCILLAAPFGFGGISVAYALAWPGSLAPLAISYFYTMRRLRWKEQQMQYTDKTVSL